MTTSLSSSSTRVLLRLAAASRYEFLMATRSRLSWIAVTPLLFVACLASLTSHDAIVGTVAQRVATWAILTNMLASLGVGVAMTDRLARTQGLGLDELLETFPTPSAARRLGSFAGSLAATLTPLALTLALVGVVVAVLAGEPLAVPSAIAAFLVVVLPGALLLSAFAVTAGLVLPLAAGRVLVVAVWFWATLLNTHLIPVPTVTGTVLSPLGDYPAAAWWGTDALWAGRGSPAAISPPVSTAAATTNVVAVIAVAMVLLAVAERLASRRRRQG